MFKMGSVCVTRLPLCVSPSFPVSDPLRCSDLPVFTGDEDEGLIAQEVLSIIPQAVTGSQERQYMLDYSRFIPVLIKAIQEQQAMIDELTQKIAKKTTTKKTT